jgi:hypothetical protein
MGSKKKFSQAAIFGGSHVQGNEAIVKNKK